MSTTLHWSPVEDTHVFEADQPPGGEMSRTLEKVFGVSLPATFDVEHMEKLAVLASLESQQENCYEEMIELIDRFGRITISAEV